MKNIMYVLMFCALYCIYIRFFRSSKSEEGFVSIPHIPPSNVQPSHIKLPQIHHHKKKTELQKSIDELAM